MLLDATTLFIAATCITGLLGIFLLVVWAQDRSVSAMVWWGTAYLIGAVAVALWAIQPSFGSVLVELPNTLLFVACGMIWSGWRSFGRMGSPR